MKSNRFYQYLNPKKLESEIQYCGYRFTWPGYLKYLLLIYTGIIACAVFFGLKRSYILIILLFCSFFIPNVFMMTYRSRYEQKKFADVTNYMEQLLYSFKRRSKVLTALQDTLALFPSGEMREDIDKAINYIRAGAAKSDIYREAFALIEKDFGCKRLSTLHQFLIKVENTGGRFEESADILLYDRKLWIDRVYELERDKKNVKVKVTIGIALSFLICAMAVKILPEQFSITIHPLSQTVTAAVILCNLFIWYTAHRKLSGSMIEDEETMGSSHLIRQYQIVMKEDLKSKQRVYLLSSLLLVPVIPLCYLKGGRILTVGMSIFLFLIATQPKRRYRAAYRAVEKEVEKVFPGWLMNLALLLQSDNVHVSLNKSVEDAPEILKEELKLLVQNIERQPDRLDPYLQFLKKFNIPDITSAMKMLYSMAEYGAEDIRKQISSFVQRNFTLMDKSQRLVSEDYLAGMGFLVLLPMLTGTAKMLVDMALLVLNLMSIVQTVQ